MSDETNEVIEATTTTETAEGSQAQAENTETDWKSESRKWEARAKAAKADSDDASKWREYEKSLKPAQERLAEELSQVKAEASEAAVKLMRYEVATQKGVPNDAIDLLSGSSREELESSADKLLSLIANQSKSPIKPDINQGKAAGGANSTADQFASALSQLL
jgi:hypothetical protein